jgi:hypothetical protein
MGCAVVSWKGSPMPANPCASCFSRPGTKHQQVSSDCLMPTKMDGNAEHNTTESFCRPARKMIGSQARVARLGVYSISVSAEPDAYASTTTSLKLAVGRKRGAFGTATSPMEGLLYCTVQYEQYGFLGKWIRYGHKGPKQLDCVLTCTSNHSRIC